MVKLKQVQWIALAMMASASALLIYFRDWTGLVILWSAFVISATYHSTKVRY